MSKSRLSILLVLLVFALIIGASHRNMVIAQTPEQPLNWIRAITWSPDSTKLATANLNGAVQIWDATTKELLLILKGPDNDRAVSVAWSPDGNKLASGGHGTLYVWDTKTGELLFTSDIYKDRYTVFVDWSPDASKLAVTSYLGTDNFWVLDGETGEQVLRMQSISNMAEVDWSPTGELIATASLSYVQVWDSESGESKLELGGGDDMTSVRWSPDGTQVASSNDSVVRTWDATTGEMIRKFTGHKGDTGTVDWSPDGLMLASAGNDNTIRIWDAATGETLHIIETANRPLTVAWSPDGRHIAYGGEDMMFEIMAVSDLD